MKIIKEREKKMLVGLFYTFGHLKRRFTKIRYILYNENTTVEYL
jgi:hypothetical protein